MNFSQRRGFKPVKNIIQLDSMDQELRVGLWNVLCTAYWDQIPENNYAHDGGKVQLLTQALWHNYFKWPLDTIDDYWYEVRARIRRYFFSCEWYEVYDIVKAVPQIYPSMSVNERFRKTCNAILERELSAYRFVGGQITQIAAEEEVAEIEEAINSSILLRPVADHLKRSLVLMSDKKSPDYRNSIKESISAVEAMCNLITDNSSATLGSALKELEKKDGVDMHPALKGAFEKLYGYTSNAEGIRHALLKEPNLAFGDAKFMLVSCSAFVNYLKEKAMKAEQSSKQQS